MSEPRLKMEKILKDAAEAAFPLAKAVEALADMRATLAVFPTGGFCIFGHTEGFSLATAPLDVAYGSPTDLLAALNETVSDEDEPIITANHEEPRTQLHKSRNSSEQERRSHAQRTPSGRSHRPHQSR